MACNFVQLCVEVAQRVLVGTQELPQASIILRVICRGVRGKEIVEPCGKPLARVTTGPQEQLVLDLPQYDSILHRLQSFGSCTMLCSYLEMDSELGLLQG